jgi:hypothetical protein
MGQKVFQVLICTPDGTVHQRNMDGHAVQESANMRVMLSIDSLIWRLQV